MSGLIRKSIEKVNADRRLLTVVLLINVAGTLFGFYYYREQLSITPWYLWLAVPDCPLYTLFMAILLFAMLAFNKKSDTFNVIATVGMTTYGVWTTIVLLYFGEIYFSPENALFSVGLWLSHAGMALEGLLMLPYLTRVKPESWALAAAWFAVLDWIDYAYHFTYNGFLVRTHPLALLEYYLVRQGYQGPLYQKIDSLSYLTFGLTIACFVLLIILSKAYGKSESTEEEAPVV